jgi:hypothetical protein
MDDLNAILHQSWTRVRRRHLFPELPAPVWADTVDGAALDIRRKKIHLSPDFVLHAPPGVKPRELVEGLLDHAVSHHTFCPWNLAVHLKLYARVKGVLQDKETSLRALDAFMDTAADTHCVSAKDTPLPKIYRHLHRGPMEEFLHSVYQELWQVDLGVTETSDLARRLARLPYLDRRNWEDTVVRFVKLLRPVLEAGIPESNDLPCATGRHGLSRYSPKELEEGLKQVAQEVSGPSEFIDLMTDFKEELKPASKGSGEGAGRGKGESFNANRLYYMKLAETWALPVRRSRADRSGGLYPHHHTPWEAGRPVRDTDPWTSFGKILPGVTQTWTRLEGRVLGPEENVPDCLIAIDSSASMKNPALCLSHAVLGAACACDAYLRNGARVAVYNFSDASAGGKRLLPFSRNREEIYEVLCRFFGGGTRIHVEDLEMLQAEPPPDIFLITDMQLTNLESLIDYLKTCPNRVTAVHIGMNEQTAAFRGAASGRNNVDIHAVNRTTDIPGIVLGKVREYVTL